MHRLKAIQVTNQSQPFKHWHIDGFPAGREVHSISRLSRENRNPFYSGLTNLSVHQPKARMKTEAAGKMPGGTKIHPDKKKTWISYFIIFPTEQSGLWGGITSLHAWMHSNVTAAAAECGFIPTSIWRSSTLENAYRIGCLRVRVNNFMCVIYSRRHTRTYMLFHECEAVLCFSHLYRCLLTSFLLNTSLLHHSLTLWPQERSGWCKPTAAVR